MVFGPGNPETQILGTRWNPKRGASCNLPHRTGGRRLLRKCRLWPRFGAVCLSSLPGSRRWRKVPCFAGLPAAGPGASMPTLPLGPPPSDERTALHPRTTQALAVSANDEQLHVKQSTQGGGNPPPPPSIRLSSSAEGRKPAARVPGGGMDWPAGRAERQPRLGISLGSGMRGWPASPPTWRHSEAPLCPSGAGNEAARYHGTQAGELRHPGAHGKRSL